MADSVNDVVPEWIEYIPDPDHLFMRVAKGWLPSGALHPGIFREIAGAISVDWEKYSTAQQTRDRAPKPSQFGVVELVTGKVRKIEGLSVQHEPTGENRAHSGIHGLKFPSRFRLKKARRRSALICSQR